MKNLKKQKIKKISNSFYLTILKFSFGIIFSIFLFGDGISTDPRAFLILDDCLYDNTWAKDKNMRYVFMNGRHYKLLFLLTMQYALGIPPNLRTNIDMSLY